MSDELAALRASIEPAPRFAAARSPVLVWLGRATSVADAEAAAAASPTFAALLRDVGMIRLAIVTDDDDAALAATSERAAVAIALALAGDGRDLVGVVALDDDAPTQAITAAFLDGAAAVQVRVLHDGVATAAAVAIACARTPAVAGYLRPARARVGGPPGTAIALALLSLRDD